MKKTVYNGCILNESAAKAPTFGGIKMKKYLAMVLAVITVAVCALMFTSCGNDAVIVYTNAFFAPFEYYSGTEIVGVDVDIMTKVGEKLGKKIEFKNVEFSAIIDAVKEGKVCDAGAAGITVTDERAAKVDFSTSYFTSIQYVIFTDKSGVETKTYNGTEYIVWEALAGKTVGVQTDTTGWIYADCEINDPEGVIYGTNTTLKNYDNAQLAADAVNKQVDVAIVDQLPAQYIVSKSTAGLKYLPLYYSGDTDAEDAPVEEMYAICVTKGNTELLNAINEVLADLLKKGSDGQSQIDKMVMSHMGF